MGYSWDAVLDGMPKAENRLQAPRRPRHSALGGVPPGSWVGFIAWRRQMGRDG